LQMNWKQSASWRGFWAMVNMEDVIKNMCGQKLVVVVFGLYVIQLDP